MAKRTRKLNEAQGDLFAVESRPLLRHELAHKSWPPQGRVPVNGSEAGNARQETRAAARRRSSVTLSGRMWSPLGAPPDRRRQRRQRQHRALVGRPSFGRGAPDPAHNARVLANDPLNLLAVDGAFKKELARVYGIHVETVRAIIQRHA